MWLLSKVLPSTVVTVSDITVTMVAVIGVTINDVTIIGVTTCTLEYLHLNSMYYTTMVEQPGEATPLQSFRFQESLHDRTPPPRLGRYHRNV